MRKNFNIPSPKSQSLKESVPKARCPALNSDALLHGNRLARPPHFPETFEADEDAPKIIARFTSSYLACLATTRAGTPFVAVVQAPIAVTIQVITNESLLKLEKAHILRRQSGLITLRSGNSRSGFSSSTKSRTTSPILGHLVPCSVRHCDATLRLQRNICGGLRVEAYEDVELARLSLWTQTYSFDLPAAVYTRCYTDTIAPPYIAQLESATNTTPGRGGRRGIDEGLGTPRAEELQLRRAEAQHRKMRKSDPVPTQVKRASLGGPQDDDIPMVTERRKSAPRGYP
ncbi:hypothetical protein V8E53_011023 [Lactarius tabidus]